ncbi:MAG TPA: histidine kinase [Propionicimonas sp.]|nr:histidine kinase [Propionicimonas sp.]HQA78138.1 histidine kinase [Propionicimonas sp.]HQD98041.1 histidine kinase [Propionicimonas sp.]
MELGSERVTAHLLVGLDLLAALLLVVAVASPSGAAWTVWAAGAVFAFGWLVVRLSVRVLGEPMEARGGWWPGGAAASGLLAAYCLVLLTSESGMWLAFPVMLLQLHLLGPRHGVVAVTLTTVAAVVLGAVVRGQVALGFVLGPVIGAFFAVAAVVGLESLARLVVQRQRALHELEDAQQRLLDAERERLRAEERANLARDIHDTLAQDFAAIDLHLRRTAALMGTDSPAAPAVALARQATAEGLAQARRFIAGEPGHRQDATMGAIQHAAERAQADSGGRTKVAVRSMGTEPVLSAELSTEILRMTQSALANVVQHAAAANASVSLTWEPDRVLLDITDDGRGFNPDGEEAVGGFGLPALRARVRELGGTVGVESEPGEGTAIAISLPLGSESA